LYVVGVVPLVSPEKYDSAMEQKKMFAGSTSSNGIVMLAPPHVPVWSACNRVDAAVTAIIAAINMMGRP
jgi:hypothetical protein